MTDKWGPWIQHNGNGYPPILYPGGIIVQIKLLNPRKNFALHAIVTAVTGEDYYDEVSGIRGEFRTKGQSKSGLDSWTLPIADTRIYYCGEYRILLPPELTYTSKEERELENVN